MLSLDYFCLRTLFFDTRYRLKPTFLEHGFNRFKKQSLEILVKPLFGFFKTAEVVLHHFRIVAVDFLSVHIAVYNVIVKNVVPAFVVGKVLLNEQPILTLIAKLGFLSHNRYFIYRKDTNKN